MHSLVGQPGFGAAVAMVNGGISHHVEDEETEAFPKLRQALGLAGADGQTKDELYEQAKEAGVEGRSTVTKDELAEAIDAEPRS